MSCNIDTESKRRLPGKLATGLALSAFLGLGGLAISANAQPYHNDYRGGGYHGGGYYHGGGRPGGWGGGYYPAPPVIYAAPYYPAPYYPPPVVYGPAIGIYAPGVSIGIGGQ